MYVIHVGGLKVFDFSEYVDNIIEKISQDHRSLDFIADGLHVSFYGEELSIRISKDINISDEEIDVIVDEESFIAVDDTAYELSFNEPTRGMRVRSCLRRGIPRTDLA